MIQEKLKKSSMNQLLKDVAFITLLAVVFFIIIGKFGGYLSDYLTKQSCGAIDEKYVEGKKPGDGVCVKTSGNIDIKK